MKKNLTTIVAAAACVLVVVFLVQIAQLKQQISNLNGDVMNQLSTVSSYVRSLYANIDAKLEQQASIIADSAWEYGDADYEAKTVALLYRVTPKTYTDQTQAFIVLDGAEYSMTLSNGVFTASVDIPLFADDIAAKVLLREGGSVRTETLDHRFSPRYDYLLNVYAMYNGGSGAVRNGMYAYRCDDVIHVEVDCQQDYGVSAITLVELLDGRELGRTDIPLDNRDFYQNYVRTDGAVPAQPDASSMPLAGSYPLGPFYYALDKAYQIPFGSTLTLYVEVEDVNGLRYRCIIDRQEISDSGERMDDSYGWMGMEASIYDADGNALFEIDPSLYA